jgi:ribonucleoside-diphosphate reductase alpha chain
MITYEKELKQSLNNDIAKDFKYVYPIQDGHKLSFDGVSRMVMLDRYSQKDKALVSLKVGDLVIVTTKSDPMFPSRGIGRLVEVDGERYLVKLDEQYVATIDEAMLADPNVPDTIVKQKYELDKPLELYFEQIARRVGTALAATEEYDVKDKWADEFTKELAELNIIPAGRVLYGAGSNSQVTYFNCYVMPFIKDSREAISKHRAEVTEIMSRGGGVGTNGSTLRPKFAPAKAVGGRSSGAVSWLHDLSQLTHLIQQGGSRRGAQMIMLADWHPDIIEFIVSKMQKPAILQWLQQNSNSELVKKEVNNKLKFTPMSDAERLMFKGVVDNSTVFDPSAVDAAERRLRDGGTWDVVNSEFLSGANISVTVSHKFMEAVEKDLDWELKYPDLENMNKSQKDAYDEKWATIGDVFEWEEMGYPIKVYNTIRARDLWNLINVCATYSAEPGIFFLDTANDMTNAKGYGQKVVATNPCGEQPLAPYSVCNLAAINLSNFVNKETKEVLYDKLKETVRVCVRMQDDVIDSTPYFLEPNKKQALGERRVGMGVMGLHDLLIWAGLRYGSKEANAVVDKIFEVMAVTAYETSIDLAAEKGSFPFLDDRDKFIQSGYLQKMPAHIRDGIKEKGLRNSHLLTIAPTGSTGTMVGCSTGLEPYFAYKYFRSGRLGKFMEVNAKIVEDFIEFNPEFKGKEDSLPEFFVAAGELTPEEHVDVQCTIQRWVDSSISKTVNAPKGFTVNQVEDVYMKLYKGGAKGGTVYVDGSRDSQVLTLENVNNDMTQEVGNEVGDLCPICGIGTLIDSAGCVTCPSCGAQLKCGL